MKQQLFGLSFGFAALLFAAEMAAAQQNRNCAQRDVVLERLTSAYGETRQSMGLAGNSGIIELHASEETGTWTITVTQANGLTCMLAAGTSYEKVEEELPASLGAPT